MSKYRIVLKRERGFETFYAQVKLFGLFWIDCIYVETLKSCVNEFDWEAPPAFSLDLESVESYIEHIKNPQKTKKSKTEIIKIYD